ncbi:MAG: O-antigen ligase family protein [Dehalococcoidia bacterium]|nr:O-antigen ligase family protein [Dehalococcoidia bacterium]
MQHRPATPLEPSQPPSQSTPPPANPSHLRLARLADAFLQIQALWATAALALVYISLVLGLGPAVRWVGLALACVPFPIRVARSGIASLRTPFDIPVALLLVGAVVGYCTSDNRSISLGPLQCIVGVTLFYYSWVNSPGLARVIKWAVISIALVFLPIFLLVILDVSFADGHLSLAIRGSGTHHGLAMYLVIEAAILFGVAAFDKDSKIRPLALILSVFFLAVVLVMTWASLQSLLAGDTFEGRWPIWKTTADLLSDSPLTGLGLGCWAFERWGTTALGTEEIAGITHTHNAYLELYSDTGILGALALMAALVIGVRLSVDIIRSPRTHPWYGFGIGLILACMTVLCVGIVESAPMGVPLVGTDTYYYVVSPIAWFLCGLLAMAHRHIAKTTG